MLLTCFLVEVLLENLSDILNLGEMSVGEHLSPIRRNSGGNWLFWGHNYREYFDFLSPFPSKKMII